MINIKEKKDCCGCTACASICPKACITMEEDLEGYKFPRVNLEKCINCDLCKKVCPILNPKSENKIRQVLSAKNRNIIVRRESSSGGLFSVFAENFINNNGVVIGCTMNKNLEAIHVICETKEDLKGLRSSKYVQSNIEGIYPQVLKLLKDGKNVLFSGTPCQIAGLRRFLLKPYENLYCLDVLCHGVPSPKLFREYKSMMEFKYKSKLKYINFRCKDKEWKRLYIKFSFNNRKEYYKNASFDSYMQLFLSNKSQRNSCFHCPFTTTNRQGDISLGDFWGIGRRYPKFDDDKGISMILINSLKGVQMFEKIQNQIIYFESTIEQAVAGNNVLIENFKGEEKRNQFYTDFISQGLQFSIAKHTQYFPIWKQHYFYLMRFILDILRKILRKGY